MRAAARSVVPPSMKTSCLLWIVLAGRLTQSFAQTSLCTILGGDERAIHLERPLVRIHRESATSKTDTPLFISLALHAAKPSINAGFCSYLLTYEEIGTTSNPRCSARRVNAISVTPVLIQATVRIPDCACSTSSKPEVDLPHFSNVVAEVAFVDEFRQHGLI